MRRQIVFFTDLNTRQDTHLGRKGPEHPAVSEWWLKRRFELWHQTAWKSIRNQNVTDWRYVIRCHPDAEKITNELFAGLKDKRLIVSYIYTEQEKRVIQDLAELANGRELVMIRLDSDDMYHPTVAAEVLTTQRNYCWFYWHQGYALEYRSGVLYRYNVRRLGPFFAHRYTDVGAFAEKKTLSEPDHSKILRSRSPIRLSDNKFIVGLTGMNTTTTVRMKHVFDRLPMDAAKHILKGFKL